MINIYLLGRLEIAMNDDSDSRIVIKSTKKRLLLEYLLLRGEYIESSELFKVLWPEDNSKNPSSALKALVSRTRAALSQFDKKLGKCIVTDNGGYYWNDDLTCSVDVHLFERRCKQLLRANAIDETLTQEVEDALSMYAGDLSPGSNGGNWFASRNAYYHTLCLRLATHAVQLLKEQNHLEAIIRICGRALDIDPYDETLHLELMDASFRCNRVHEKFDGYRPAGRPHYSQYSDATNDNLTIGRNEK